MDTHRSIRHAVLGGLAASTLLISACGSDADESAQAEGDTTADETPQAPSEPSEELEEEPAPATTSAPAPTTTTEPAPTTAPPSTVPADAVPVREGNSLTAGWTYATQNLSVPITFTTPDDEVLGRWRSLFDTSNYVILTLQQQDKADPTVVREEPGLMFYALPDEATPEQFVEAWTNYAAEQESFTVETTDGEYLDQPATVISGTYELGEPLRGAFFMRLDGGMTVPIGSGERRYLNYLVPVGDRTVVVQLNAHELDWDLNVTLANQIVDSVEFQ